MKLVKLLLLFVLFSSVQAAVLPGIDQLLASKYWRELKHKRVGLLINSLGRDEQGQHTLDVLVEHGELQLTSIFMPEYRITDLFDEKIKRAQASYRGVPVYSLNGQTKVPSKQQLAEIDVLVFDLQPVGIRFYTYITTLAMTMKVMQDVNKPMLVIERPHPQPAVQLIKPRASSRYLDQLYAYYLLPIRYDLNGVGLA